MSRRLRNKRSSLRNSLKQEYLEFNPMCEWCGQKGDTVHHRIPFHVAPEYELERDNLMTLCDNRTRKCHFCIGHLNNRRERNPELVDTGKMRDILRQ